MVPELVWNGDVRTPSRGLLLVYPETLRTPPPDPPPGRHTRLRLLVEEIFVRDVSREWSMRELVVATRADVHAVNDVLVQLCRRGDVVRVGQAARGLRRYRAARAN